MNSIKGKESNRRRGDIQVKPFFLRSSGSSSPEKPRSLIWWPFRRRDMVMSTGKVWIAFFLQVWFKKNNWFCVLIIGSKRTNANKKWCKERVYLMVKEGRKRESDGEGEEVSLLTSFLCLTDSVVSESKKLYSSEFVFCGRERRRGKGIKTEFSSTSFGFSDSLTNRYTHKFKILKPVRFGSGYRLNRVSVRYTNYNHR